MTSQECNKQLLNDIIQRNYIKYFQNGNQKTFSLIVNNGAVCCTNCITDSNYSDFEMDLGEIDFNKNLNICLDWYINNQCQCDINIIGQDDIDLFNYTLETLYARLSAADLKPHTVWICSNGEFLTNPQSHINDIIKQFRQINIDIKFRLYFNGQGIDEYSDDWYNQIDSYIDNIESIIAYITPDNISKWMINYLWWLTEAPATLFDKMTIKEKNYGWTEQTVEIYQQFYTFYLKMQEKLYSKETIILNELPNNGWTENVDYIPCNLQKQLCIYVPNNRLIICPGMLDDLMTIGYLTSNGDFSETNVALNVIKDHIKIGTLPRCEYCPCVGTCNSFCWVESFKDHGNMLVPCPEYCLIRRSKFVLRLDYIINNNLENIIDNNIISPYFKEYLHIALKRQKGVK